MRSARCRAWTCGAITPITDRLLTTAVERAQADGAQALVVQLNTPGGLERSMRTMAQTILNAGIPVIVYVAPTGARAASAGVFITMAAHVAAMPIPGPGPDGEPGTEVIDWESTIRFRHGVLTAAR